MEEEKRSPDHWQEDINDFITRKQHENEALRKLLETLNTYPADGSTPDDYLNEDEK